MKMQNTSLGEQVSKRMSIWILILVITISTGIVFISYLLSKQMFNQQVEIWNSVTPQYTLSNLIDSDHFSINKVVKFLESTGLFSSFVITDNQKRVIAKFGELDIADAKFIPIQDEGKIVWGYYSFTTEFYKFFSPFLISVAIYCALVILLYFIIRWRIRSYLELKFSSFNRFLQEIEGITEKIHELCSDNNKLQVNVESAKSVEQEIINRSVTRLMNEIRRANISLREAISEAEQKRFQEELTKTAMQVAHDIGSPLAVLETIVQSTSFALPEENRISLRNASARIRDITNSLLKKAKHDLLLTSEGLLMQQHLPSLVKLVVDEKKLQYQHKKDICICLDLNEATNHLFALIKAADFSRILSNIINNSVEAIAHSGHISISLSDRNDQSAITIIDNGRGMPPEILSKLGSTIGITHGKAHGLGLGLYHAINTIESWGGFFKIQSQLGKGTVVEIDLPQALPPAWFVFDMAIANHQEIIIIDDDLSIHDVWKMRFALFQNTSGLKVYLRHFYTPDEFRNWFKSADITKNSALYLCDYEFIGTDENGIDLIAALQINYLSILVTSRFISDEIVARCEAMGIKLLPKNMASSIAIYAKNN